MEQLTEEMEAVLDQIAEHKEPMFIGDIALLDDPKVVNELGDQWMYMDKEWQSRRPYEHSRYVCRLSDNRCFPEILLLALLAYGKLRPNHRPYWKDKNWLNNVQDNVAIAEIRKPATYVPTERNPYGFRSGTPEYRKAYAADPKNRARQREHNRKHQQKKRSELKEATKVVESTPAGVDKLAELRRRLGLEPDEV